MANFTTPAGTQDHATTPLAPTNVPQADADLSTIMPLTVYAFTTLAEVPEFSGGGTTIVDCPPPSNLDPGDYPTQLFVAVGLEEARTEMYEVAANVRTVVREYTISNTAGSSRTVDLWLADLHLVFTLAAGEFVEEGCFKILYPSDLIEMQASGDGVGALLSGVEEVSEA